MKLGSLAMAFCFVLPSISCYPAGSETFTDRADVRSPLMDVFSSYASVDEVRQRHFRDVAWFVVEDSKLPANDPRPRFDILTVSIPNYAHVGHKGELRLAFFNDRLSDVWFYPEQPDGYLASLGDTGLELVAGEFGSATELTLPPFTRVWATRDYRDRLYVGWEDTRLGRQQAKWIERYA